MTQKPPFKIYVASSWRNSRHPSVVKALREDGHDVYDFRNPAPGNEGFAWRQIDEHWQNWTTKQYVLALQTDTAQNGFAHDMNALKAADVTVLVLPCGRSAHLELGFAAGGLQKTFVLSEQQEEPELMYLMCDGIFDSLRSLRERLDQERQIP